MNNTNKKNINNSQLNMIDIKLIKEEAKMEELEVTNAEPELKTTGGDKWSRLLHLK